MLPKIVFTIVMVLAAFAAYFGLFGVVDFTVRAIATGGCLGFAIGVWFMPTSRSGGE